MISRARRSILCPVDIDEPNSESVRLATELAKKSDATLELLYVSSRANRSVLNGSRTDWNSERKKLFQIHPIDDSVHCRHRYVYGSPGPEILNAAVDCDMIVMATHRENRFLRWFFGSVTEYVIRRAPCPVVTVHER